MSTILSDFFEPYVVYSISASSSLGQNLSSIGWFSYWQGFTISPNENQLMISILYSALLAFSFIISVLSAFSLRIKLGFLAILAWASPGIFSVFETSFVTLKMPDTYHVNDGSMYVGETYSTLLNVFMAFIIGWSLITLLVHWFKIRRGFKEVYDHIWYSIGLIAVVFFVVDSNTSFYKSELDTSERNISDNISITNDQLNFAHTTCLTELSELIEFGISNEFCEWIPKAKFDYYWKSQDKSFTRELSDTEDISRIITKTRLNDIEKFNEYICSSEKNKSSCNMISFEQGRFDPNYEYMASRYALAVIPLNKSLSVFYSQSSKANKKLSASKRNSQYKWFFYMLFGVLVGGKVAISTRSLFGDPKPVFRHWVIATSNFILFIGLHVFIVARRSANKIPTLLTSLANFLSIISLHLKKINFTTSRFS